MNQLNSALNHTDEPILQVPLHFNFQPIEILSKQLTKLNSTSPYRIVFLGPRWQHSTIFHKIYSQKHGYPFEIHRVNKNNTFFSESMSNNQHYRNQMYYRAFEGNNPTLDQKQLIFDSRFESGNLDCVVKICQNEYDLFLRIDSNTRGHLFWYYFSVKNAHQGQNIKFNICNLTKKKTLYNEKLKPYVFIQFPQNKIKQWSQDGTKNVAYEEKKLRYEFIYEKIKVRKFYTLSFTYTFEGDQQVRFAYCIPYTYSNLRSDLKELSSMAQIKILGKSLTGVDIPVVKIGYDDIQKRKQVVLVTSRVHPGQSNGSLITAGLMKFLCFHPQAQYLRQKVIFIIIPMINPDGVIIGNSRTGASGKDLNRQFKTTNKSLYPQIILIKQLIRTISMTNNIDIYLDFHGHSRKKNMFLYGPSYNVTETQYYKCRLIPKLISLITPIFRYYSCNYTIPQGKKSTARAVMLNQFQIPFVYTIQCSIGFYHDFNLHKDLSFTQKIWQIQGESIGNAIKQYSQAMQQYQNFIENRKNRNKPTNKQIQTIFKHTLRKNQNRNELKIMKLFQEIKSFQQKNFKQTNNNDSDASSDSYNDQQDLQKQQMIQFQSMVTNYVQTQTPFIKVSQSKFKQSSPNKNNIIRRNPKKISKKQQMSLFNQFLNQNKTNYAASMDFKDNRKQVQSHRYNRTKQFPKNQVSQSEKLKMLKIFKISHKRENFTKDKVLILETPSQQAPQNQKKPNFKHQNNNMTIFNFSKMIQNPKSLHYQVDLSSYESLDSHKPEWIYPQIVNSAKFNKLTLFESQIIDKNAQKDESNGLRINDHEKMIKFRNPFPASFYRIKYQSVAKNKKTNANIKNTKNISFEANDSQTQDKSAIFLSIQKLVNK